MGSCDCAAWYGQALRTRRKQIRELERQAMVFREAEFVVRRRIAANVI